MHTLNPHISADAEAESPLFWLHHAIREGIHQQALENLAARSRGRTSVAQSRRTLFISGASALRKEACESWRNFCADRRLVKP